MIISTEIISLTKDIIFILAAISTTCIARKGLETWSRELRGKADFEVARSLIRSMYKLREELNYCRSAWIQLYEFPDAYDPLNKTAESEAIAYAYIYKNRWKPVSIHLQEFEAQALEGEALWGASIKPKTDELRQCIKNLHVSIEALIDNYASGDENFRSDSEFAKSVKSDVRNTNKEKNKLTLNINESIKNIETEVRPHFKRS